jgi:RNA polymerase sigma-70 factor (ECF subfamily)
VAQRLAPVAETGSWFEQEVTLLLPQLLATARRLCRNSADAEDLVADSVARAWQQQFALRDQSKFRGWLFRIMTNHWITAQRNRAGHPETTSLEEEESAAEFSLFERLHQPFLLWWSNPEEQFLNRLLREDLERALEQLPANYRLVVLLADVQGFSYQEIAETLGVPVGTVRSRLARGRSRLQKTLWLHAQDAGLAHPDTNPAEP